MNYAPLILGGNKCIDGNVSKNGQYIFMRDLDYWKAFPLADLRLYFGQTKKSGSFQKLKNANCLRYSRWAAVTHDYCDYLASTSKQLTQTIGKRPVLYSPTPMDDGFLKLCTMSF